MKSIIKAAKFIGGQPISIGTLRCAVCDSVEDELHLLRHMPVMIGGKVTLITVCTGECAQKVEMMPKIESVESLKEVNEDG